MVTYASLFAGIGGFELGINAADPNAKCIFASENNKFAKEIYKKNFGVKPYDDITEVNANDIPSHDILCAGFPCQAFSIAGKRRGFEDCRGTLFFEIMRIAKAKRPTILFLENVRGLLSHDKGKTFHTILRSMDELGYDAEWQVFNSKNHGVPQNRERVFIIGHLRGGGIRQIFPIGNSGEATKGIQGQCANTITARYEGAQTTGSYIIEDQFNTSKMNGSFGNSQECIRRSTPMRWVRSDRGKALRKHSMKNGKDYTPFSNGCRELIPAHDDVSGCITNAIAKDALVGDNNRIRRLTPIECERLQGFPDNWTRGISDTQRYKCLGNAVTVNVVEYISKNLLPVLEETLLYKR